MEEQEQAILEMDEVLEKVLGYTVDEAQQKLIEMGFFEPFTVIVEGDNMFIESYPGDNDAIRACACDNVKTASSFANYYCFAYDGYIDSEEGTLDAIIVECADRDQEQAYAIAQIYKEEGDTLRFEEELAFVGECESFFDADIVAKAEADEFEQAQRNL